MQILSILLLALLGLCVIICSTIVEAKRLALYAKPKSRRARKAVFKIEQKTREIILALGGGNISGQQDHEEKFYWQLEKEDDLNNILIFHNGHLMWLGGPSDDCWLSNNKLYLIFNFDLQANDCVVIVHLGC